jgi:CO/xanthine dehydrogenase FAD-binding subunit
MKPFSYFSPRTLREAIDLLVTHGQEAKILAGGTDLLVEMKEGILTPEYVIDLKNIPALNHIKLENQYLKIGALATVHEIEIHPSVREYAGILAQAASLLGSLQIRNKGTIGGNLCHASPAADLASPLLALDGRVRMIGKNGERTEELENFFVGPGITTMKPDEILTEIQVPIPPPGSAGFYLKFSPRKAMDLALVGVAALITLDMASQICTQARIALGSMAPTPVRVKKSERILEGKRIKRELLREVSDLAAGESRPISDIRGSAWYRKEVVKILIEQGIMQTLDQIHQEPRENQP